jgi:glycosyltransferase involved in cell wall biosynthesis
VTKLCINGKFLCQQITGTQRYAHEVLHQFDELLKEEAYKDISIEILVPRSATKVPAYRNLTVRAVGRLSGTLWEQLDLPRFCGGHCLFTPSGSSPLMYRHNAITMHDASVFAMPEGYSLPYRMWYRLLYRTLGRTARVIFTVSHFSKAEIVRWCGARADRIVVTYLGADHIAPIEADLPSFERLGITGRYLLTASSNKPNKNFARTVEAISFLDSVRMPFIIAGGSDSKVYGKDQALPAGALPLGYVTNETLKALYENAECFVFASLYEGFGLPPLEAASCGCPIVLARSSSLEELFGDVATFCDPYSSESIAAAIRTSLQSPPASKEELMEFAQEFRWEKCARQTLDTLRSVSRA